MKAPRIALCTVSLACVGLALACGSDPVAGDGDHAAVPETAAVAPQAAPEPMKEIPDAALFSEAGAESFDDAPAAENQAPALLSLALVPAEGIRTTDDVTAMPTAEDPDGDPVAFRYRWKVNGRPIPIDAATLPADRFDRGDRIELTVEASDGDRSSFPMSVGPVVVANSDPKIQTSPGPLDADGTFRYEVGVEDPDADFGFRYELRDPPDGMRIDPVAGAIVWTPRPEQAGVHHVRIAVDDRHEGTATQDFDLTIEFPEPTPAAPAP